MSKMARTQLGRGIAVDGPEDIPGFESEEEEARFWAEHELGEGMLDKMHPLGDDVLPPARADGRPTREPDRRRVDEQGRAHKGSQRQVQTYVNWRTHELNQAIAETLGDLRDAHVEWVSPLQGDGFREYRDLDFLTHLGLEHHAQSLGQFWPVRGPVWDALALVHLRASDRPAALLVEAKSYPGEMYGGGAKATARGSVDKIRAALEQTQLWLGVPPDPDPWLGSLYQHANRLAHLYWLNEVAGVRAWLAYLLFVDDHDHRPSTRDLWRIAVKNADRELRLDERHVPGLGYVLLQAVASEET